jgi:hypothetical protein
MNTRQKQVMDSLVRVRAFLDAHPASGARWSGSTRSCAGRSGVTSSR